MRYQLRQPLKGKPIETNTVLDRVLRRRGIKSLDEIDYNPSKLLPYDNMKGMDEATAILADAIENNKKVLVVGDYDCDGATATTIAVEGLQTLGSDNVQFMVPDRFIHGYGLTPTIVELAEKEEPDVILTVDNGISSISGAEAVKNMKKDCKLVVTDHHLPGRELPDADAIVNPQQPGCEFESKALAGCGVMFYVLMGLRDRLDKAGFYKERRQDKPGLGRLLDVVALGTVADLVPLDRNNRILVNYGLERINAGFVRPGIRHLLELSKREIGKITASDFGFVAGPRINSAGRLDDMTMGIKCLMEQDDLQAKDYAYYLDSLNRERKLMQSNMSDYAIDVVGDPDKVKELGLCVYHPEYHEGIVGLVASRIKENYHRPVVVFAESDGDETMLKGSGRSIPGVHLRDVLDSIATRTGLFDRFGGHAMAAGMSMKKDNLEAFKKAFNEEVSQYISEAEAVIETDGELRPHEFTMHTADILRNATPWGQAFPAPVFEGRFEVEACRVLKDKHLKLRLRPIMDGQPSEICVDAIAFKAMEQYDKRSYERGERVRVAYSLEVNEFMGDKSLQLMAHHLDDQYQLGMNQAPKAKSKKRSRNNEFEI